MIANKQKKTKKKRLLSSGQLSTDEMGLKSISSNSVFDPDYIKELVNDTRKFSHMLLYLKEAILSDSFKEAIHTRLDELLCVLKSVMNKHQNLNSVDLQHAAEMLTAKVKAVNFTDINEENKNDLFREVFSSIESLAFTFGNILTNFLMGDVGNDSLFRLPVSRENKSFENISMESVDSSNEKELDSMLLKNTDSVELALSYAKTWSKYTKNIMSWVEKKLNFELESTRNIVKLAEATRTNFGLQEFMPLQSLFTNALLKDIESSHLLQQTIAALQANKFVQPLLGRKNEMEKQRKEMKELWKQEQNKMLETETALKKAKLLCIQRQDEYEKAKSSMFRAEEEHQCSSGGLVKNLNKQLEKKRRLEEEALQKVEEANELYKVCMTNVEERRSDLENTKKEILAQLRKLVFQCDLTLKAVTVNFFRMQRLQAASLANSLQSLCDSAKLYDPGQEYTEFIRATSSTEEEKVDGSITKQLTNSSHTSGYGPADSLEDVARLPDSSSKIEEDRCSNSADVTGPPYARSWTMGMFSDSESTGGSSESRSLDSESISPGDFHRKLPRTPSSGTMSSADDLDEREPPSPSEAGPNSLGTYKKTLMSKAALTHKFRKLRSPTKCRDCEGIVVFQGVECEECLLVCHRKCLENLVIICGHQKLLGKMHLFGAEFTQVAKKEPDGIPFILKICASEIESRALCLQGIYRVSGNKIKTEKLCQALENGMHLVDISEFSSHDICDVLKLYLRQLPEPFVLFRLYKEFIDLAKEIQHVNEEQETKKDSLEDKKWPSTCIKINRILLKSKDLLRQLPVSNFNSLHYLIVHLKRVVDHAEENKMNSKNLGVIFGPSLIRPRPTAAPITISSLAEYSNQARLVEFLITYSQKIFDGSLQPQDALVCSAGGAAPPVEQGCLLKPLVSPEERDPEHFMKQLFFSSKEDIYTAGSETKVLEPTASFEESEQKQNVLEKCDACLIGNRVHWLTDQELDSASQKMEDVSKTSKAFTLKSNRETNSIVERHTPRTKIRPVSLPVDRLLLLASSPHERNGRDIGNVNSDQLCKNTTFEGVNRKDTSSVCCKFDGVDQGTLQKTGEKRYEQNDLNAKTSATVPSALQEGVVTSIRIGGDPPGSATQPSKPYTEPVMSARQVLDRRSSNSCPPAPVRAPRTLQPQHWTTFYKPRAPAGSVRGVEERPAASSPAHAPQGHVLKSTPDSENAPACPLQPPSEPNENSEEHDLPGVQPPCQRPRLKRMQQFEDLEDEAPQSITKQLTNSSHTSGYGPADSLEDVARLPDSSSKIEEDRCSNSADVTGPNSLGTYKKTLMSKAALTHKFRKLRSPTKCRDCEGIVVFQGVECEECLLVCHRTCLENLVIICGHQTLLGKMHLFGAKFKQVAKKEPDGIPFILKICASEIESRALCLEGIYHVNGNKIKTEKLCQALENGMHLVDISEFSSYDICDVLKLYLRQLPEPFVLFRLYKEFIDLAKEIQHVNKEQETKKDSLEDKKWPSTCIKINRILLKSKDLLRQLPVSNFNSLHYLIVHLKRVVDHAEENKMNSKNLGVIFGPSLIRPRPTAAPITISSLAEYSNQARLVEFLITYSQKIFDGSLQPQDALVCSAGGAAPPVEQGCLLKPLVSPEERDPEHFMKQLFFSSKEDIHTAGSETKVLEPTASFEESEQKQNVLEKCDACLIGNRVHWLTDQELDSALKSTPDSENAPACPLQPPSEPNENSEEHDLPGVQPPCQRPRLKRMQQFEDLEDEAPQFV